MPPSPKPKGNPASKASNLTFISFIPSWFYKIYALAMGLFLGFSFIKFGNPVILDRYLNAPSESLFNLEPQLAITGGGLGDSTVQPGFLENLFTPWSISHAYGYIITLIVLGLIIGQWRKSHLSFPIIALGGWLGWQWIAALFTIDPFLTRLTLTHVTLCAALLFVCSHSINDKTLIKYVLWGILPGFLLVLWHGFGQHYGGLAATQKWIYEQPNWQQMSREFLVRISTGRVFATLVYPNALATLLLLVLPALTVVLWRMRMGQSSIFRGVATGVLLYAGGACLIWSGSKSGWLIALIVIVVAVLHLKFSARVKWLCITVLLVIGLAGFAMRFSHYFEQGATSVGARFDYWRAAVQIAQQNPLLGTGPGTFSIPYSQIKAPEAEMARLVHNDYLEQASDSGIPGFILYLAFVCSILVLLYRRLLINFDAAVFAIWLGILGFLLHGSVEFGLYIPAISWTAFAMMGMLWGCVGQAAPHPSSSTTF